MKYRLVAAWVSCGTVPEPPVPTPSRNNAKLKPVFAVVASGFGPAVAALLKVKLAWSPSSAFAITSMKLNPAVIEWLPCTLL